MRRPTLPRFGSASVPAGRSARGANFLVALVGAGLTACGGAPAPSRPPDAAVAELDGGATADAGYEADGGRDGGGPDAGSPDGGGRDAGWDVKPPHVVYPGDPACGGGCEGPLRHPDILIPARNGQPWGDTYLQGPAGQHHLAGYSSGRIALLRRLALRDDGDWAILLDPSWEDGARDFLQDGRPVTGPSLVKAWLQRKGHRRFLLFHSTQSVGWKGYADLQADPSVGSRVRVCTVGVGHLSIPQAAGAALVLDPGAPRSGCR